MGEAAAASLQLEEMRAQRRRVHAEARKMKRRKTLMDAKDDNAR